MEDDIITNRMLLEHMQAGHASLRHEFRRALSAFKKDVQQEFQRLEAKVDRGFEEARKHREGLQEDLEATIKMQAKHDRELAVLTGRPLPEEY